VEFKKFFMDEWTGELNVKHHQAIRNALGSTLPGLLESLENMGARV
jgi:N-formylglutamate deformylase